MGCTVSVKVHTDKTPKRMPITKDTATSPIAKHIAKHRGSGGTAGFFREDSSAQKSAIVVGIDVYDDPKWPNLQNAGRDALAVHNMLQRRGFTSVLLRGGDATYKRVWQELERVHGGKLVVSFHGHGCRGLVSSFACSDSSYNPHDTSDKITSDQLRAWSRRWDGKEFVMFADFCYGGDMVVPTARTRGAERTRIVLSAGMMREKTLDGDEHSPFTRAILQVSKNTQWKGSVIDLYVRVRILARHTKIGRLPGDEGGDVFV